MRFLIYHQFFFVLLWNYANLQLVHISPEFRDLGQMETPEFISQYGIYNIVGLKTLIKNSVI